MKLEPYIEDPTESALAEVLSIAGLKKGKTSRHELDDVRSIFNEAGAGIEDVAKVTASLIRAADKEETKLRACELALKVQGIFKELDDKQTPVININVVGEGNQALVNLLCPRV